MEMRQICRWTEYFVELLNKPAENVAPIDRPPGTRIFVETVPRKSEI